jgi:hypothetical protein
MELSPQDLGILQKHIQPLVYDYAYGGSYDWFIHKQKFQKSIEKDIRRILNYHSGSQLHENLRAIYYRDTFKGVVYIGSSSSPTIHAIYIM